LRFTLAAVEMQPAADKHDLVPEHGRGDQEPAPHPAGIEARQQDGSTDKERGCAQTYRQGPSTSECAQGMAVIR
jgi:hypothetical protein